METTTTATPWKITKEAARHYGEQKLAALLSLFCRAGNRHFYMVDFNRRKMIMNISPAFTLSGYTGEVIKKEGFDFYRRIVSAKDYRWLLKMLAAVQQFFAASTPKKRRCLEYHYDLVATTAEKQQIVLHHKMLPYEFCANGNLWLALCGVTSSPLVSETALPRAVIADTDTGELYNFEHGTFVLSGEKVLTAEEITILERLFHGMSETGIAKALHISDSSLRRKLQQIREKLKVSTICGAMGRACMLGAIGIGK